MNSTYHIFFNHLANPLRINIISYLRKKEMSVNELANQLKIEQSKLSHALSSLKECRIVSSVRKGKQIIYSLNKDTIIPILELIENILQKTATETANSAN